MTTGPAHWELLLKARAVDSQLFTAGVSPARDPDASYVAWGHSTAVSPFGEVLAKAGADAGIFYADMDLAEVRMLCVCAIDLPTAGCGGNRLTNSCVECRSLSAEQTCR